MRQVRIELTTLGLWDLGAASCASATMNSSRSSGAVTHRPSAQLRSKLQHEVLAIDTDCRALVYSRMPQRMGRRRSACRGAPLAFGVSLLFSGRVRPQRAACSARRMHPYQVRSFDFSVAGEDRIHDLRIMRPTRCQLRYCHDENFAKLGRLTACAQCAAAQQASARGSGK